MPTTLPKGTAGAVGAILYDWPYGAHWWADTTELIRKWHGIDEPPPSIIPPYSSSGGGVGSIPYARYDEDGRRIAGEVVVVSSLANNAIGQPDTFGLPDTPQTEGFVLKVINDTDRPIQAMFPYVFTYYGSAVYGQPYPVGPKIYPTEAAIYRVVTSQQGKMAWNYEASANRVIS